MICKTDQPTRRPRHRTVLRTLSQALGPMVRPLPVGSPDITLACLSWADTDRERCWEGERELVGAEQEVLARVSWFILTPWLMW